MRRFPLDLWRVKRLSGLSWHRPLFWLGLAAIAVLATGHMFQENSLYAASPAAITEEHEENEQNATNETNEMEDAEQGPPSLCERGRLLARPDVAGTQPSLSPLVIPALANDGPVPALGAGNPGPPAGKGPNSSEQSDEQENDEQENGEQDYGFEITHVGTPARGEAEITDDGTAILYTVPTGEPEEDENGDESEAAAQRDARTFAEPLNYTDIFTYTIQDTCDRVATAKVVVVVFGDDMPATPAIITRSHNRGERVNMSLSLPISATLRIPDSAFGDDPGDENGGDENGGEESGELGARYFSLTELEQSANALAHAPGLGLRFAKAAFRLSQFLDDQPIPNPTFEEPLILEIVFDPALLDENGDENGEGTEPQLFYWNEESQSWESDGIVRQSFDPQTGQATFAIYHLTEFALFGGQALAQDQESIFIPIVMGDE